MKFSRWAAVILFLVVGVVAVLPPAAAQGSLSQQVLQLLTRTNSWTGANTFYDLHVPLAAIPSVTATKIYADLLGNLYYQDTLLAAAGGGTTPHNLLSTTHPDTLPASVARGALVVGNSTPKWAKYQPSVSGCYVQWNGTDTLCATSGATLTAIPAANLTGTIAAISGVNLTALNASNLGSGTVPLARLSGITNSQVSASAGIVYSKLDLVNSIIDADIDSAAAINYSKLDLNNSIVAGDITAGAVTMAKIAQAGATSGQVIRWSGTAWAPATIAGAGTVTSVAATLPAIFSLAGSPITTSGTLAVTLASQTANRIWAAPDGLAGAPTFRAFVNADLPTTGVVAGSYPKVTVNAQGIVTAAAATINAATELTGIAPRANGGTGVATAADDSILVGSGSLWVQTAIPNCTTLWSYSTTTNLVTCSNTAVYGTLSGSSTPFSITATWSNVATNFTQFLVNVTNSASAAASYIADLQVGGVSYFSVRKDSVIYQKGIAFADLGTPANGSMTFCTDCLAGSDPCTGSSTGAFAFRRNSAWACY